MFDVQLFLGFLLNQPLQKKLSELSPDIVRVFLKNGGDYLHETNVGEDRYIGKFLGQSVQSDSLEDIAAHIKSLALSLWKEDAITHRPFVLLSVMNPSQ